MKILNCTCGKQPKLTIRDLNPNCSKVKKAHSYHCCFEIPGMSSKKQAIILWNNTVNRAING